MKREYSGYLRWLGWGVGALLVVVAGTVDAGNLSDPGLVNEVLRLALGK